jgi:hypothetical protein
VDLGWAFPEKVSEEMGGGSHDCFDSSCAMSWVETALGTVYASCMEHLNQRSRMTHEAKDQSFSRHTRKPKSSSRVPGTYVARSDTRAKKELCRHDPFRRTICAPVEGPLGSAEGLFT